MKCSQIKETIKDVETRIRKLDNQILIAKHKLQVLKRMNNLHAKLKIMKLSILRVPIKENDKDGKQRNEIEQDLSQMLGNMLSIQSSV